MYIRQKTFLSQNFLFVLSLLFDYNFAELEILTLGQVVKTLREDDVLIKSFH